MPNDIEVQHASLTTSNRSSKTSAIGDDANGGVGGASSSIQPHQVLQLRWSPKCDRQGDTEATIPIVWLRQHCTSSTARQRRQNSGAAINGAACRPSPVLWGADLFSPAKTDSNNSPPCVEYDSIVSSSSSSTSSSSKQSASSRQQQQVVGHLVSLIRSHGIALVRGVPTTEAGTEALALAVGGHLRSTLYGPGMWATSAEPGTGEEGFRDSAYSNCALASHTDCSYLVDPPGLQVCGVCGRVGGGRGHQCGN